MSSTRSRSSRLRLAALGLALSMVAGIAGAQVFGTPDNDFRGSVRAATPLVLPGGTVEIAGSGFKPGQAVTLLRGETVLNPQPYVADAEGGFKAALDIPADAVAGRHPVIVRVANPDAAAVFDLKISKEVPLSGQDRFDVVAEPLVRGLYQVVHGKHSDALFVTAAVGRPPVTDSELLKLDPRTLEITARATPATVPGRDDGRVFAVYGVGVDDANGTVWVTNTREDTVAVYSQSDLSLVKQFEPGVIAHPRDVVVDAANGRVWVSSFGGGGLKAFDASGLEVVQEVEIASGERGETFSPMGLAFDPVARKLYSVSLSTGEVAVVDSATGAVDKVFRIPGANGAIGVAVDPANRRVYVAAQGSDNLLIADADSGRVLHDVYVGAGAVYVAFDPVSGLAYVPSRVAGTIAVVDGDGNLVANLDGGTFPNHVHPDGRGNVFATNKSRGENDPAGDHIRRITPKAR